MHFAINAEKEKGLTFTILSVGGVPIIQKRVKLVKSLSWSLGYARIVTSVRVTFIILGIRSFFYGATLEELRTEKTK